METPARLLTGHGKSSKANVCGNFLKEKCGREKANSTVRFKTLYFEKFILWEIAARKLDSYLSVEIVTDKPTSGKIYIPQDEVVSVAKQTGLPLTWSQTQYLCHAVFMCINSAC